MFLLTQSLTHRTIPSPPPLLKGLMLKGLWALVTTPPGQRVRAPTGTGIEADRERQEGRTLRHVPSLCSSAELERLEVKLSQHPSQGYRRRVLQLFLLPSTLSKQDRDSFGKERREH